ncbi:threonylcarbamoyl-AMP synthase [Patescibacteria group bacterium]|nr:threonylcarbamoyl-AMP synthase [Patescibacteria group bacterium]
MKELRLLSDVASVLKKGGVVAFPTETSYGLLCNAYNEKAIDAVYTIKGRGKESPLSLLIKDVKMAEELCEVDERTKKVFNEFYPGPVTIILPAKKTIHGVTYKNTNAIRVSSKKEVKDLFEKITFPLSATSANVRGENDLYSDLEVVRTYKRRDNTPDALFLGGTLQKRKPSTIIDLSGESIQLTREGEIPFGHIKQTLDE